MASEKQSHSHPQERTLSRNAHHCSEREVNSANEIAADTLFNQDIKDDYIKEARNKPGE